MSYSIFYRSMFLKMQDGTFIPFIESGDNNVWVSPHRRARDWCACRWFSESSDLKEKYSLTRDDILCSAEDIVCVTIEKHAGGTLSEKMVMKDFGYYSGIHVSGTANTAGNFLGCFRAGFRNAITWDELQSNVILSFWDDQGKRHVEFAATEDVLAEKWNRLREEGRTIFLQLPAGPAETAWLRMKRHQSEHRKFLRLRKAIG